MARTIRNVTRKAFRKMVCGDWRRRAALGREVVCAWAVMQWLPWLCAFGGLFAEQTSRSENQDEHQQAEHDGLRPLWIEDAVGDRGDDADEHTAHKCALNVADPAHDRCRKGVQTRAEALKEPGRIVV